MLCAARSDAAAPSLYAEQSSAGDNTQRERVHQRRRQEEKEGQAQT